MSEYALCPACRLQHTRRADGLCPRCKARMDRAPAPAGSAPLPMGARIAGGLLLANALAIVLETALGVASSGIPGHPPIAAAVHDLVIGAMLVGGVRKVLAWTVFRVCAGALLFVAMHVYQGDRLSAAFQLAFSASLLLLLLGAPGRPRVATALAIFSVVIVFEIAGIIGIATGRNVLASTVLALRGDLERAPRPLTGTNRPWRITPPDGWFLRTEAAARKDNALADRWLIRPDLDAHIMVISEHVERVESIDPDALARAVLGNVQASVKGVRIIEQGTLLRPAGARTIHAVSASDRMEIEYLYGVVASGSDAYQIVTFAPRRSFAEARPELEAAIASFQPAPR